MKTKILLVENILKNKPKNLIDSNLNDLDSKEFLISPKNLLHLTIQGPPGTGKSTIMGSNLQTI